MLVQEKSKAQAEGKKAVARVERDAEAKLIAQRDEFAKHERSLRERIVQLQNQVTEARRGKGGEGGDGVASEPGSSRMDSTRSTASVGAAGSRDPSVAACQDWRGRRVRGTRAARTQQWDGAR